MALHQFFQDNADQRAYFEKGFDMWFERTREQLVALAESKDALSDAKATYEAAKKLPASQEDCAKAYWAYNRLKSDAGLRISTPQEIQDALDKLKEAKPSDAEALATILSVREGISNKIGPHTQSTEEYYGPQSHLITMNTNGQLNGLPAAEKATLFEYFNLVQDLSVDSPTVISLAEKIAERRAKADLIGPQHPEHNALTR